MTVEIAQRNKGALLDMPSCIDCKKAWKMYESEKLFFQNLVDTKGYYFPKRCSTCRAAKRKNTGNPFLNSLAERLTKIGEAAPSVEMQEDILDLVEELEAYSLANPRGKDPNEA